MKDNNTLQEIKKGQVGKGLLIEHDGYISMDIPSNHKLMEDMRGEEWHCPYPFIVDAVFQKYGIKNANGRVYPENVLKREVEKYQERIRERRALGECYTPDVLILCEDGWKCIADVSEDDNVLTLNVETNEIEIQKVSRKIEYDYNGKMIHLEGRNISETVTPNHGYPVFDRNKKFKSFYTAENILKDEISDMAHSFIPNVESWDGIDIKPSECKFSLSDGVNLDKEFLNVSEEDYEGKVMCIEVPNHTFYVMSNGRCHWSKNCNHPSESTLDLSRISHNIIELHWEGATLVGKMELNVTEGFRRHGIVSSQGDNVANLLLNGYKIGVSSRAVGSVENKLGVLLVQDDLELVCWDVVGDPSTPGAWIGDSQENLSQYVESDTTLKGKSKLQEKINKLHTLL